MSKLSAADDLLHPPAMDDRWWSETYWFSFDVPGENVSATIYPLFRPNLGICSLGLFLWDASSHVPWNCLYGRNYWHLAMPTMPATELRLEGLSYDCLETLQRYHVQYHDGDLLDLDLEYIGVRPPHEAGIGGGVGHFDQVCHVKGEISVRGRRIAVDSLGMRDRTWSPRPEYRRGHGTAYTFGHSGPDEQFLAMTKLEGNSGSFISGVFTGYLVRDGIEAPLVDSTRRVTHRREGYPVALEIEAVDSMGRKLEAVGRTVNRFANQATPSQFAWLSMTDWEVAGRSGDFYGEDQEVWSPDKLGAELQALNTAR
jgi:hypothetical protein